MNRCAYRQRNVMGGCEEERVFGSVVCPKPRRLSIFNPSISDQIRPFRSHNKSDPRLEKGNSSTEAELDVILTKGYHDGEAVSPPPFYSGSPPSRAPNPLIQDSQFDLQRLPPPPSSPRVAGGGCVRLKFGQKPAAVRIEGFAVA